MSTLYLLPNVLSEEENPREVLTEQVAIVVQKLDLLIAESEKAARKYLSRFSLKMPLQQFPILLLNEHTKEADLQELLKPLLAGNAVGLISDAGLCCIADPGSSLVFLANKHNIPVVSLAGPSSIFLALQLSGLSGQNFSFCGYLPREKQARIEKIKQLEKESLQEMRTIISIEAPYRSHHLAKDLIENLKSTTMLCFAINLGSKNQTVACHTIAEWKLRAMPTMEKRPTVFLWKVNF